jgi:hypothetical protein
MNTIRKITFALLCAVALIYIPGCFIDLDDGQIGNCRRGSGPIVSEQIEMAPFSGIDLRISGKVFVRQGATQRVVVEAQQNVIDEMEFNVRNGIWEIRTDRCMRYNSSDLRIFVTLPDVRTLRVSGSGDIISENTLLTDDLDLRISGSGRIDLAINAEDVLARISGSGDILLEGLADYIDLSISGSGSMRAFDLPVYRAKINISGSGNADVAVSDNLEVRISGSGDVRYKGSPAINAQISGSGKLRKAN